jgi:lysophospholipase L1-like esterase
MHDSLRIRLLDRRGLHSLVAGLVLVGLSIGDGRAGDRTPAPILKPVRVAKDGKGFVVAGAPFVPWGFNYLGKFEHLAEEDWGADWAGVEADFRAMRKLGANVVRWHLQFETYMKGADEVDAAQLGRLKKLLDVAAANGLYLDLTGLSCYRLKRIPAWYDKLDEADRWKAQAKFWAAVAETCAAHPAVFCYDLMNEPVVTAPKADEHPWVGGELGGFHFVQRIANKPGDRDSKDIAEAWVKTLVAAIRAYDKETPVTVGVIPWAQVWPTAKPIFYSPQVIRHLDFVSVHFYPAAGKREKDLAALAVYDLGKPLVVEEIFPLSCSMDELDKFIDGARPRVNGWLSHYFGATPAEHRKGAKPEGKVVAEFLEYWQRKGVAVAPAADFALKDGDTVVFLGDSITAARTYGKLIENYTLLRFPERKVRFVNAGQGGDTASGGLKRLDREVFAHKPTVVTVAYGVNDIGWGTKADADHKKAYLDGVRGIVEACANRGVRVYVCSAAATAEDPAKAETGFLQTMCDEGMDLAKSLGGRAIDVQRSMRAAQKRVAAANAKVADKSKHDTLHTPDGVHLSDLGQWAMAFAILKGLGAPADVSAVEIDAAGPKVLAAAGCAVTNLAAAGGGVAFTRLDAGLPLNGGLFSSLHHRFLPVPSELNGYTLTVKGLAAGGYDVTADRRAVGTFTAVQLAEGVNLASATADPWQPGGPWDAQAKLLLSLTDARHEVGSATRQADEYLPGSPVTAELGSQGGGFDDKIVAMQRTVAKPLPYQFVVKPSPAKAK